MRLLLLAKKSSLVQNGLVAEYKFNQKNLLKYSEDFSNAVWSKPTGLTYVNGYDDPFGGKNAWLLNDTDSATNCYATQSITVPSDSLIRTASVYVKQGSYARTQFYLQYSGETVITVDVVITWGTLYVYATGGRTATLTAVGNDWYRVSVSSQNDGAHTSLTLGLYGAEWVSGGTFTGSSYFAYPQIELGSVATAYEKTLANQDLWNSKKASYAVTNLITNGNFANGLTGWTPAGATASYTENTASIVGDGTSSYPRLKQTTTYPAAVGDIIYMRAKLKVEHATTTTLSVRMTGSTAGTDTSIGSLSATQNIRHTVNGVLAEAADYTGMLQLNVRHSYSDTATALGKEMKINEVFAVNLTAIFGAGNEPATKEQCDLLFPEWFEGTRIMQLPKYNGQLGSTTSLDTNDPTWTGQGLSFTTDDYVKLQNVFSAETDFTVYVAGEFSGMPSAVSTFWSMASTTGNGVVKLYKNTAGDVVVQLKNNAGTDVYAIIPYASVPSGNRIFKVSRKGTIITLTDLKSFKSVSATAVASPITVNTHTLGATVRASATDYLNRNEYSFAAYTRPTSPLEDKQMYRYLKKELAGRGVLLA